MTNATSSTTNADPITTGSIPDFMPSVDIPGGEMLFGGADILFGEEDLMDMYSGMGEQVAIPVTSIEGGADVSDGKPQGLDEGGAMAHLLSVPPAPQDTDSPEMTRNVSMESCNSDVGGQSAADDGLGAMRPNTSFNDFTHLMPPTTTSGDATCKTSSTPANESITTADSTVAPPASSSGDAEKEVEAKPEGKPEEGCASSSGTAPNRKSSKTAAKTSTAGRGRKRVAAVTPEIQPSNESTNPKKAPSSTTARAPASVVSNETGGAKVESTVVAAVSTTSTTPCASSAVTGVVSTPKINVTSSATTTGAVTTMSTAKRRRVTAAASSTTKKAAAAAAARKAAAAEAVAAFAPLAQNQVAKIRQSASILANPGNVDGGAAVWKLKQKLSVKAAAVCDPLGKSKSTGSVPITAGSPLDKVMVTAREAVPAVPPAVSGDRPSTPVEQVAPGTLGVVTASSLTSKLAPALISPCIAKDVGKIEGSPTNCTVAPVSPPAPVIPKINVGESSTTAPTPASSVETAKTTATARVAALTSSPNWISQNGGTSGTSATASAAAAAAAAAASKRARRQNLTPDERARQNRDRNREHARNTRLRKKAYVEELKKTLTEVVAERDAALLERQFEARREGECRDVRRKVMEEFLRLRAAGGRAADEGQWNAILDSNFVLKLPVTSYRKMAGKDVESSGYEQVLHGTDQVMADAAHIAEFVCNLGRGRTEWSLENSHCRLVFECDQRRFFMDGFTAVLDWTARTIGAINQGCTAELCFRGSMRATFVPSTNKLLSSEMSFDTGAIAAQLHSMSSLLVPKELLLSEAVVDANALLDSLDVPHFDDALLQQSVKSDVAHSVTSSEKSECSCDEGEAESRTPAKATVTKGRGVATRRGGRKSGK